MESAGAATLLTKLARRRLAKKSFSGKQDFRTWNQMDAMNENMAVRSFKQFANIFATKGKHETINSSDITVESTYNSVRLTWPLSASAAIDLLEAFKDGHVLHPKYVLELLEHGIEIFRAEENVQDVSLSASDRLTIVGDLHGQLQDLLSIFKLNGIPDQGNIYIFNGDFVDRGNDGVGVVCTLLALKCVFPKYVYLNRGNHECRRQNKVFGFEEEVLSKYRGVHGRGLLNRFHEVFDTLPLCCIIQRRVFVVHGGLADGDGVTLDLIGRIDRYREPPIGDTDDESILMECMLWSDPSSCSGVVPSSRGAGMEFGQDCTMGFLRKNKLSLIIRSHECVPEGYELTHGQRLITLFSASRYCGKCTNKGAYLTMTADLGVSLQQYYAHSMEDIRIKRPVGRTEIQREMAESMQQDMVEMIIERIVDLRPKLYEAFLELDVDRTGYISRLQWAAVMTDILEMQLPFLALQPQICDLENCMVPYIDFMERYQIAYVGQSDEDKSPWGDEIIHEICRKLHHAMGGGNAEQAFQLFDTDGSGQIDSQEFMDNLKKIDVGLSEDQISELMRGMDNNKDQTIDLTEFLDRFKVVFDSINYDEESSQMDLIKRLAGYLNSNGGVKTTFLNLGVKDSGWIDQQQFAGLLASAGLEVDDLAMKKLINACESERGTGRITPSSLHESIRLKLVEPAALPETLEAGRRVSIKAGWQDGIISQINNIVFQHRREIGSIFRDFDFDNSGYIDGSEFLQGFRRINAMLEKALTDEQIISIHRFLDKDGDGNISYAEFLGAFKPVDAKKRNSKGSLN